MTLNLISWNIRQLADAESRIGSVEADAVTVEDYVSVAMIADQACRIRLAGGGYLVPDVILVMEVMRTNGGLGVDQIAERLGYTPVITSATTGAQSERYAMLYNPLRVTYVSSHWGVVDPQGNPVRFPSRCPAVFTIKSPAGTLVDLVLLHAPPTAGAAATALQRLSTIAEVAAPQRPTVLCGDFNVDISLDHVPYGPVVNAGWQPLFDVLTSLRMTWNNGDYRKAAFDNIFVPSSWSLPPRGDIDFIADYGDRCELPLQPTTRQQELRWTRLIQMARSKISDHLPLWVSLPL